MPFTHSLSGAEFIFKANTVNPLGRRLSFPTPRPPALQDTTVPRQVSRIISRLRSPFQPILPTGCLSPTTRLRPRPQSPRTWAHLVTGGPGRTLTWLPLGLGGGLTCPPAEGARPHLGTPPARAAAAALEQALRRCSPARRAERSRGVPANLLRVPGKTELLGICILAFAGPRLSSDRSRPVPSEH